MGNSGNEVLKSGDAFSTPQWDCEYKGIGKSIAFGIYTADNAVKVAAPPVTVVMGLTLSVVDSPLTLLVLLQFHVAEPSSLIIKSVLLILEFFSYSLRGGCLNLKREALNLFAEFNIVSVLFQFLKSLSWE